MLEGEDRLPAYALNDLFDDVVQQIILNLEQGRDQINGVLYSRRLLKSQDQTGVFEGDNEALGDIIRGHNNPIARFPAITVDSVSKTPAWLGVRVREDTFRVSVECVVRITKKQVAEELVNTLAAAVQNWLLAFQNLSFEIGETKVRVYDSFTTEYTKGYRQEGSLRVARMEWYGKVCIPYVATIDP